MNGSINISIADGWIPEFANHGENSFIIPHHANPQSTLEQDQVESENLFNLLENEVLPLYYKQPDQWQNMLIQAIRDVIPNFESGRMAKAYYEELYRFPFSTQKSVTPSNRVLAEPY